MCVRGAQPWPTHFPLRPQSGFNDGDEASVSAVVTANDGYVYVKTAAQPWWQAILWDFSDVAGDTDEENKFLSLCHQIFGYNAQASHGDQRGTDCASFPLLGMCIARDLV